MVEWWTGATGDDKWTIFTPLSVFPFLSSMLHLFTINLPYWFTASSFSILWFQSDTIPVIAFKVWQKFSWGRSFGRRQQGLCAAVTHRTAGCPTEEVHTPFQAGRTLAKRDDFYLNSSSCPPIDGLLLLWCFLHIRNQTPCLTCRCYLGFDMSFPFVMLSFN